jgi:hypothetical protein
MNQLNHQPDYQSLAGCAQVSQRLGQAPNTVNT